MICCDFIQSKGVKDDGALVVDGLECLDELGRIVGAHV